MLEKCILISFIFIFLFLYLYVKIETFYADPISKTSQVSSQILTEISRILRISKTRLFNLVYYGDYTEGKIFVAFGIKEPTTNNEASAIDSAILTSNLISNNKFIIKINGKNVLLSKIRSSNPVNNYFDNSFLKTISKYSTNKYITVPNDESLTKFYKLDFDKNYNIVPKI